jgi:hypothetical protein
MTREGKQQAVPDGFNRTCKIAAQAGGLMQLYDTSKSVILRFSFINRPIACPP